MLSLKFEIEGADKVVKLTKGQISLLTRSVAAKVRGAMKESTPVETGATKRSWTPVRKVAGGYSFSNVKIQSYFLEYGSEAGKRPWPSPGLRTVYYEGRVYSSQAPKGISEKADVERIANKAAGELFVKMTMGK
jgi:hypothetical protein